MSTIRHALHSPHVADRVDPTAPVALLLHGFGSHERDLPRIVPHLGWTMRWASLRAPLDTGAGAAWFPIARPGSPDPEPVVGATDAIWAWVDEHLGDAVPVVPIGFSQGGLMASQLLRSLPERVPAAVVLGGFVLGAPQPGDATLARDLPPVFWGRGADDLVISPDAVARTAAFLPQHSTLDDRVYAGLAHGISAAELADVRRFLSAIPTPVTARTGAGQSPV